MLSARNARFAKLVAFTLLGMVITACTARTTTRPIASTNPVPTQRNLKVETFTLKPSPTGSCAADTGQIPAKGCNCVAWWVTCENKRCVKVEDNPARGPLSCATVDSGRWCEAPNLAPTDGRYCLDKPVIYLYPEQERLVDVSVVSPGKIVASIPSYGVNGWSQVLARPSGQLTYQGRDYTELFYETAVASYQKPTNGITLPKQLLKPLLTRYVTQLGLVGAEQEAFLSYWVPRLEKLDAPYILFSLIDPLEKDRIDRIVVYPAPQTRIEILAYFRPLQKPFSGPVLVLPQEPPKRNGFTLVEWGGTVDPAVWPMGQGSAIEQMFHSLLLL